MSREQLEQSLQRLREELQGLGHEAGDERVRELVADLERQIQALDSADSHRSLADQIKSEIVEFEVEHPRVTHILNDLMVTLSNMGI